MTVQAGIEVETALEVLVGEFEEQACESVDHGNRHPGLHNGNATHYARVNCLACGFNAIKAYCNPFSIAIANDCPVQCFCGELFPASEIITVLARIRP